MHNKKEDDRTHGIPLVCDTTGIHREVEELLPSWAPTEGEYAASEGETEEGDETLRTNLMATL
jgi:hypothetical protein